MINYLCEEEIIELNKYSLYATGEDNEVHVMQPGDVRFLLKNNYNLLSSNKEKIEFEEWRLKYEEENDLEREFFRITNIENAKKRTDEIMKMMNSRYGKETLIWLKNNYMKY